MKYYAFISGLPDLHFEEQRKIYTISEFKEELSQILSKQDKYLTDHLFLRYDNENLLSYLKYGEEKMTFNELAVFSQEDIVTMVVDARNEEWNKKYPFYLRDFLFEYFEKEEEGSFFLEDHLAGMYYHYLCSTKNVFLRQWSELNMNIRNILTALSCRKNGIEHEHLIVGQNDVAKVLRTSQHPNHNLIELIDYFEAIKEIDETRDILEKEQRIDYLLWNWIEENVFFHYFDIEKIMGYLFKLQIIERWRLLDPKIGEQIFRELVGKMKRSAKELKDID